MSRSSRLFALLKTVITQALKPNGKRQKMAKAKVKKIKKPAKKKAVQEDSDQVYSIGFSVVAKYPFDQLAKDPLSHAMMSAVMDAMIEVRNREEFVDREIECQVVPIVIQSAMEKF